MRNTNLLKYTDSKYGFCNPNPWRINNELINGKQRIFAVTSCPIIFVRMPCFFKMDKMDWQKCNLT